MTKRKRVASQPHLWKATNGLYLMPLGPHQYPTVEFRKFRVNFPDVQVCFLKNAKSMVQAILAELADPSEFKEKDSHYYTVESRKMGPECKSVTVGKFELKWTGKHITCLGSRICKECFLLEDLHPRTCPRHRKCQHGTYRVRTCDACVARTLLGYWKERIDCYQGDKDKLFNISRCATSKHSFKCGECKHYFRVFTHQLTNHRWCPFCANKQLCDDIMCQICEFKSFASHEKSKYWTLKNTKTPREVFKQSNKTYWFCCDVCQHNFAVILSNVLKNYWCPFCAHKQLCDDSLCELCNPKSFASHEKSKYWVTDKNTRTPREIFKSSHIIGWFRCDICSHNFEACVDNVTRHCQWCPFCSNQKLCENSTCQICEAKSFASHEKSKHWILNKNNKTPRQVLKGSNIKAWFFCQVCEHEFQSRVSCILRNQWCSFCPSKKLCTNLLCKLCKSKSFANHDKSKYWIIDKNDKTPRQVFKGSHTKAWFHCTRCAHDFESSVAHVCSGKWCPFCVFQKRCDQPDCTTCSKSCDVCKVRKAQTKTQVTKTQVCWVCLVDAMQRDPKERPLIHRAKVSLEIYMLAELQRQATLECDFLINDPTAWDCAVLPGLGFKPDFIWCFDEVGDVITLGNTNKLNLFEVKYVLQLEVLEDSRKAHSEARRPSDEEREADIRELLKSQCIPLGLVYVTVAHNKHFNSHPDDVFFSKPEEEYQVMRDRMDAWIARIQDIRAALLKLFEERSNETVYIGH